MEEAIRMNKKQRQMLQLAMEVIRQKLTVREFSLLVNKSYRQSKRIVSKVRFQEVLGVIHGNQGRTPR